MALQLMLTFFLFVLTIAIVASTNAIVRRQGSRALVRLSPAADGSNRRGARRRSHCPAGMCNGVSHAFHHFVSHYAGASGDV